jgi:hypothetical protein
MKGLPFPQWCIWVQLGYYGPATPIRYITRLVLKENNTTLMKAIRLKQPARHTKLQGLTNNSEFLTHSF